MSYHLADNVVKLPAIHLIGFFIQVELGRYFSLSFDHSKKCVIQKTQNNHKYKAFFRSSLAQLILLLFRSSQQWQHERKSQIQSIRRNTYYSRPKTQKEEKILFLTHFPWIATFCLKSILFLYRINDISSQENRPFPMVLYVK